MRWVRKLQTLWPFGTRTPSPEAEAAVKSAELSHKRALGDRDRAAAQRVEAEHWAALVKAHNVSNRFDEFLAGLIQGRGR